MELVIQDEHKNFAGTCFSFNVMSEKDFQIFESMISREELTKKLDGLCLVNITVETNHLHSAVFEFHQLSLKNLHITSIFNISQVIFSRCTLLDTRLSTQDRQVTKPT